MAILPSKFSVGDPEYRGPILLNPGQYAHKSWISFLTSAHLGGPGGSGVQYLMEFAEYFREIIGPAYDLVGFDPRGWS